MGRGDKRFFSNQIYKDFNETVQDKLFGNDYAEICAHTLKTRIKSAKKQPQ